MSKKQATKPKPTSEHHLLIHSKHLHKKKLLVALLAVVVAIVLVGIGFVLLANKAAASYDARRASQKQHITSVIDTLAAASHNFKHESSDIKALQKQVEQTNSAIVAEQPAKLDAVPLGGALSADYKNAADHQIGYKQNIADLQNTTRQLVTYMHCQQQIHHILASAAIKKSITDEASAKAAQQAWVDIHQKFSKLHTDDGVLNKTIGYLSGDAKQLADIYQAIVTAYQKEDNAAIEKQGKTVATTIQRMHTYAESLASYRLDLDYKLTMVIHKLI